MELRSEKGQSLTIQQKEQLNTLLNKNADLFNPSNATTPFAEHVIKVTDDTPISVPPYRMSDPKKLILKRKLDKLLKLNQIEECESAHCSPVVLVPKKNGEARLCVDYQRLNAVTEPDRYPLPRLGDYIWLNALHL